MTASSPKLRSPERGSARSGMPAHCAHAAISRASPAVSQLPSPASTSTRRPRSTSRIRARETSSTKRRTCATDGRQACPAGGRQTRPADGRPAYVTGFAKPEGAGQVKLFAASLDKHTVLVCSERDGQVSPLPQVNAPSTDKSGVRGSSNWKFACTGPAKYLHPREATTISSSLLVLHSLSAECFT